MGHCCLCGLKGCDDKSAGELYMTYIHIALQIESLKKKIQPENELIIKFQLFIMICDNFNRWGLF